MHIEGPVLVSVKVHGAPMSPQTKHIYEFGPFRLDAAEHLLLRDEGTEEIYALEWQAP